MSVYLKEFENHTQYENYINGSEAILPNVSICTTEGDVHYNPYVEPPETRLVAKFNVTNTSNPTPISYKTYSTDGTSGFSAIEIDGVKQPSVVSAYTFSTTGEHTVKYTLKNQTRIGEYALTHCFNLTSIDIPDSVTSIGTSAFACCASLTTIDIPSGVTSIGDYTFNGCTSLTTIDIPSGVTSIGDYTFSGCTSLTTIDIPSGVTSIGTSAFNSCISLTSIDIPSGVTSIGTSAFSACTNLTSADIQSGNIGNYAFQGCSGLTTCTIGSGVTSIGHQVFRDCSSLTSMTCNATTAPTIQNTTFYNVRAGGTLTVPSGSSGYDVWMGTGYYYLGRYEWTKVEQ